MIQCEHFIYGIFPKVGYKLVKSSKADKLLSEENFQLLMDLGKRINTEGVVQLWFPTEKTLTATYLCPSSDEYGRQGMWNHTILLNIDDYLKLKPPELTGIFNSYFIHGLTSIPKRLEPLQIG
jgi:hypothetical protein